MLRSLRELFGYRIGAEDGDLGKVHNLLFDDQLWRIRYMVAETGNWLNSRRVLISTGSLGIPKWDQWTLPVSLTLEQIRNSPDIDTDLPVSRQQELAMNAHYGWPAYWAAEPMAQAGDAELPVGDPHLRSVREVIDYRVRSLDGELGHVADFIGDDDGWFIRYLAIETRDWLPGKKVLVAPDWIASVSWSAQSVAVNLPQEVMAKSPEYGPSIWVNRVYETELYRHYGRRPYWERQGSSSPE